MYINIFFFKLGVVYHSLKDFQKAEMYYKEAVRLNPQDEGTIANYQKLQKARKNKTS